MLRYDSRWERPERKAEQPMLLEWVNGCPTEVLLVLARINGDRATRLVSEIGNGENEESKKVEETLKNWNPPVEEVDGSANSVMRLAVHESWRHAAYVYLYMVRLPSSYLR